MHFQTLFVNQKLAIIVEAVNIISFTPQGCEPRVFHPEGQGKKV